MFEVIAWKQIMRLVHSFQHFSLRVFNVESCSFFSRTLRNKIIGRLTIALK